VNSDDCPITKAEFIALQQEMRNEAGKFRESIDQLKSTKHTPFFGALALFAVIWGALWSSMRDLENEVDLIHVEIALALQDAREFRLSRDKDSHLHEAAHGHLQARFNKMVDIMLKELGVHGEGIE
jgi:hypothetical protein